MAETLTAIDLHEEIKAGKRTATGTVEACFEKIEATDGKLGAFLSLSRDLALETAETVDKKAAAGEELPFLAGVPIALKDNINVAGYPTTCASRILENYVSPYNATVTEKLQARLMPIIGKTNLDEFAMGSSNELSAVKIARNPWNPDRVPGGSSGGSAVAVSAGQVPLSLGSETGGSVRLPAAFCGLYGIKPTYGLVSRYGLVAYGSSLDQVSPFARNVHDLAALLDVIAGFDRHDSTSIHQKPNCNYFRDIEMGISGLRVGVIGELSGDGMQPEVVDAFQNALKLLESQGATVETVSIPSIRYGVSAYYILATAEASSNLSRFDGVRYGLREEGKNEDIHSMYRKTRAHGFGAEVKRRIMLGTFCLSSGYYDAYYNKAQQARAQLKEEFQQAWEEVDVLVCPTSPTTAFKIGEKTDDPVSMYLTDIATIPANITGVPAISIPCGFDKDGLPIGLQIMGPHLAENLLFRVARSYERETDYTNLTPA